MLDMAGIPADFKEEEQNLLNEFTVISGVSDVASSSANATVSSGTALEILIEQDNERMTVVAERYARPTARWRCSSCGSTNSSSPA